MTCQVASPELHWRLRTCSYLLCNTQLHNRSCRRICGALDEAVACRFGSPKAVPVDLQIRADNGSQFGARAFLGEVDRLGIELTYTPYRSPQGNAIVEPFFRSLKEECVWRHRFQSFQEAELIITEWIRFYNDERVHSRLGYRSPRQ